MAQEKNKPSVRINQSFLIRETLYELDDGTITWGRFDPPKIESRPEGQDIEYKINKRETPAQIANQFYTSRHLWWVIAYANEMMIPAAELRPGQIIDVPDPEWVEQQITDREE